MKKSIFSTLVVSIFFLSQFTYAQIVISKPQLGFTQACANDDFNEFNINFTLSNESSLNTDNQFNIELSNASGEFINSTLLTPNELADIKGTLVRLKFSLPIDISGDNYRLRVNSSSPAARSSASNFFPAYFRIQDSQYTINNLERTAEYCPGGSFLLTIDNPGAAGNISPLQFPSLTYNWFREISQTESELVASSNTYEVTQPGTYFVETNYGPCSSRSFSNRVVVTESQSNTVNAIVSSSLGNPYCITEGPTTLSASASGSSYQWFLDNNIIDGATQQNYITNMAGNYTVTINNTACTASASIDLVNSFTSSLDVPQTNFLQIDETLVSNVITNADSPDFTWFLNNNVINNQTSNSLEVNQPGNYKVVISQTTGCIVSQELTFEVTQETQMFPDVSNIPNIISPNNDGINDTWVIPQDFVSGTNTKVVIISSKGKVMLETSNYENNWPIDAIDFKTTSPVFFYFITSANNQVRKGFITVIN